MYLRASTCSITAPRSPSSRRWVAGAPSSGSTPVADLAAPGLQACVSKLSATFHTVVTHQPASRFWPFQWAEMGIFLAAALVLCGFTYWWLRRQYA